MASAQTDAYLQGGKAAMPSETSFTASIMPLRRVFFCSREKSVITKRSANKEYHNSSPEWWQRQVLGDEQFNGASTIRRFDISPVPLI